MLAASLGLLRLSTPTVATLLRLRRLFTGWVRPHAMGLRRSAYQKRGPAFSDVAAAVRAACLGRCHPPQRRRADALPFQAEIVHPIVTTLLRCALQHGCWGVHC